MNLYSRGAMSPKIDADSINNRIDGRLGKRLALFLVLAVLSVDAIGL